MTSKAQTEFDFDHAALLRCVTGLKPKALRTVFGGLLLTAASEPHRVADICEDGYMLMAAPIDVVAGYANVHQRTLQRNRDKLVAEELLNCQQPPNSPCIWLFRLPDVLPDDALRWFQERLTNGDFVPANSKMPPRHFQNATPAIATPRRDDCHPKWTNATPNAGVANAIPTSSCFKKTKDKLASLLGSGFSISETWESLRLPPEALQDVDAIQLLFELAVAMGVIADTPADRSAVFRLAAMATTRDSVEFPVGTFRTFLASGWHLTTSMSRAECAAGDALLRRADGASAEELLPEASATEAWQMIVNAMAQHDFRHESDAIRSMLPPDVYAAARQVKFRRIADSEPGPGQTSLRREFSATLATMREAIRITGALPVDPGPAEPPRQATAPKKRYVPPSTPRQAQRPEPTDEVRAEDLQAQAAKKQALLQQLRTM